MINPQITIRDYTDEDWSVIDSWWKSSGEVGPLQSMMPPDSSFIAEIDCVPALAVCLYLTNTKEICYVENFIGNPDLKGNFRKLATAILLDHITLFANRLGYKRLICMTEKPVLVERYKEIGFIPTLSGVTTFVRSTLCPQQ
jgi:hypothetical protein